MKKTIIVVVAMIIGMIISTQVDAQKTLANREVESQIRLSGDSSYYDLLYDYLVYSIQNVKKAADSVLWNNIDQEMDQYTHKKVSKEMYEIKRNTNVWHCDREERVEQLIQKKLEIFISIIVILALLSLFGIYLFWLHFKSLINDLVDKKMKQYGLEKPNNK